MHYSHTTEVGIIFCGIRTGSPKPSSLPLTKGLRNTECF